MLKLPITLSIILLAVHIHAQFCEYPIGFGKDATGGAGGSDYVVTNKNNSGAGSLRAALESTSTLNITFSVSGTIILTSDINIKSNKTVDGDGTYIRIRPFGFRINNQDNVIIRNLHFDSDHQNHGGSGDAIFIYNGSEDVWIDHCSFEDYYDGLIDITLEADYVTVSWCYFRAHDKTMLIGANDNHTQDSDDLHVTIHHCWFDGTTQRHPRARFGRVHCYNNWYDQLDSYGIASVENCQTFIENCRFENVPTLAHTTYGSSGAGKIEHTGNQVIGGGSIPNTGGVFNPSASYLYTPDVAGTLMKDMLEEYAGYNTTTNLNLSKSGNTYTAPFAKSYSWFKNDSQIGGATNQSYTATTCGEYAVRIYGDNGCYRELTHFHSTGQPSPPTATALGPTLICASGTVTLRSSITSAGNGYQWLRNGRDIPGATSRDYVVANLSGDYAVKFTGAHCNSNFSFPISVTHNSSADCNGVCGGAATLDDCGVCSGGNNNKDCSGDCFGTATIDSCGQCAGGNTGISPCQPCADIHNIQINAGWNLISSYISPDSLDLCNIFDGIAADVILVKDPQGKAYIPSLNINTIGDWIIEQGYKVKSLNPTALSIGCTQIDPVFGPIILSPGWNMIAYLRNSSMEIVTATGSILPNVILIKEITGASYIPSLGINTINLMQPGVGYQVKMFTPDTLFYPGN